MTPGTTQSAQHTTKLTNYPGFKNSTDSLFVSEHKSRGAKHHDASSSRDNGKEVLIRKSVVRMRSVCSGALQGRRSQSESGMGRLAARAPTARAPGPGRLYPGRMHCIGHGHPLRITGWVRWILNPFLCLGDYRIIRDCLLVDMLFLKRALLFLASRSDPSKCQFLFRRNKLI